MKWFIKNWQLIAAAFAGTIAMWAVTNVAAQTVSDSTERSARVTKFTYVKDGESCLAAFSRLDEKVTVADCIKAAERKGAGVQVLWYRPDISKPPTYIVNLHPGDKLGVYEEGAQKTFFIFPRDPVLHLSSPIPR